MVDWHNPEVVAYSFFLYEQIAIFLLGFYGTQFMSNLTIEWEIITRKRAFRFIHIPYFLARYITLTALLFFVITGHVRTRVACDAAYRTFASLGSFAAMLASLTLCSRPATIFWTLKCYTPLVTLAILALVQMVLVILQGVLTVRARWDPHASACVLFRWDSTLLAVFYLYTFAYDVVILLLTLLAVRRVHKVHTHTCSRWTVGDVLCIQGIRYVLVTCIVNVPVAVLAFLNFNAGMDVLLSLPAMTISVIASSLTLLALEEFGSSRQAAARTPGADVEDPDPASEPFVGSMTTHVPMHLSLIDSDDILDFDLRVADKTDPQAIPLADLPARSQEHV